MDLAPGDRVALVLPTAPSFFDAFFGVMLAGLVPVPLYPPVRLGRLDEYHERTAAMLRASGARLVLSDKRIRRLLGRGIAAAQVELGCEAVDALAPAPAEPVAIAPDDLAFIQFSSGTTVAPKPVRLTHRQVLANVDAIRTAILSAHPEGPSLTHVGVSWLPLYHDMGLVGGVFVALSHPSDQVLIPPELFVTRPATWLRAISRWRGTTSPAPNFAYGLCADRIGDAELDGVDLSSWRVALNGAEPVTPGVLQRFVDRFAAVGFRPEALTPVYGLAEASLAVTFSSLRHPFRSLRFDRDALVEDGVARRSDDGLPLVSVGPPLPGFGVRIADDEGRELAEGRLGRLWVRGPSLMQGYHALPDATAAALCDGWLDTGDTGFVVDGELYLFGRAKDVIVLRGRNYAPQDVEHAIDDLAGVRTGCSAAVGVVGDGGEELVVLIERRGPSAAGDAALADRVARRITERTGLVAARVLVLDAGTLPRTSSGKIRRSEARRLLEAGRLGAPQPVNVLRVFGEMLRSQVAFARVARRRRAR
jgi:acyl-CoA synthetase (AMP-forming)/AMP-acid ligase II